jgi:hypothetical protein
MLTVNSTCPFTFHRSKQAPSSTFPPFVTHDLCCNVCFVRADWDASRWINATNLLISHGSFLQILPAHYIWSTLEATFPTKTHGIYCVMQPFEDYVNQNYARNYSSYITVNKAKHLSTLNIKVLRRFRTCIIIRPTTRNIPEDFGHHSAVKL